MTSKTSKQPFLLERAPQADDLVVDVLFEEIDAQEEIVVGG